jgi:uncharacterized OsmC-like protein
MSAENSCESDPRVAIFSHPAGLACLQSQYPCRAGAFMGGAARFATAEDFVFRRRKRMKTQADSRVNGLDLQSLGAMVEEIKNDNAKGFVRFKVASSWKGQTRSETQVKSYVLDGQEIPRTFTIAADEPTELLGQNTAPNPQELLMSAFNACIMVGYVATAAVMGVPLESVEIETEGELNLRGFLGIDDTVKPGYDSIQYTVRIKGNGTPDQFQAIHENVLKTSPNYFNIARPITVNSKLVVG